MYFSTPTTLYYSFTNMSMNSLTVIVSLSFSERLVPTDHKTSINVDNQSTVHSWQVNRFLMSITSIFQYLNNLVWLFIFICQLSTISTCQLLLWRISESNRWPPACKAGALASWANPPWFSKWACVDSNHGPLHYQCSALTTWATSPFYLAFLLQAADSRLLTTHQLAACSLKPVASFNISNK